MRLGSCSSRPSIAANQGAPASVPSAPESRFHSPQVDPVLPHDRRHAASGLLCNNASRAGILPCFRRPETRHAPQVTRYGLFTGAMPLQSRSASAPVALPASPVRPPQLRAPGAASAPGLPSGGPQPQGGPPLPKGASLPEVVVRPGTGAPPPAGAWPLWRPCRLSCLSCFVKFAYKAVKPTPHARRLHGGGFAAAMALTMLSPGQGSD